MCLSQVSNAIHRLVVRCALSSCSCRCRVWLLSPVSCACHHTSHLTPTLALLLHLILPITFTLSTSFCRFTSSLFKLACCHSLKGSHTQSSFFDHSDHQSLVYSLFWILSLLHLLACSNSTPLLPFRPHQTVRSDPNLPRPPGCCPSSTDQFLTCHQTRELQIAWQLGPPRRPS